MNFKLVKKSSTKALTTYQVLDGNGNIRGSVNLAPEDEADFLRCWNGATDQPTTAREARAAAKRTPWHRRARRGREGGRGRAQKAAQQASHSPCLFLTILVAAKIPAAACRRWSTPSAT